MWIPDDSASQSSSLTYIQRDAPRVTLHQWHFSGLHADIRRSLQQLRSSPIRSVQPTEEGELALSRAHAAAVVIAARHESGMRNVLRSRQGNCSGGMKALQRMWMSRMLDFQSRTLVSCCRHGIHILRGCCQSLVSVQHALSLGAERGFNGCLFFAARFAMMTVGTCCFTACFRKA